MFTCTRHSRKTVISTCKFLHEIKIYVFSYYVEWKLVSIICKFLNEIIYFRLVLTQLVLTLQNSILTLFRLKELTAVNCVGRVIFSICIKITLNCKINHIQIVHAIFKFVFKPDRFIFTFCVNSIQKLHYWLCYNTYTYNAIFNTFLLIPIYCIYTVFKG